MTTQKAVRQKLIKAAFDDPSKRAQIFPLLEKMGVDTSTLTLPTKKVARISVGTVRAFLDVARRFGERSHIRVAEAALEGSAGALRELWSIINQDARYARWGIVAD